MSFTGTVSFEGNEQLAKSLLPVALSMASSFASSMEHLGLENASKVFDLGQGCYCYVLIFHFKQSCHIITPTRLCVQYKEPVFERSRRKQVNGVADVVSGVSTGHTLNPDGTWDDTPEDDEPARKVNALFNFRGTTRTNARYSVDEQKAKLGVQEQAKFTPLRSGPNQYEWSQYDVIKPTKYSGKMRKVVQLLLGLGYIRRKTAEMRWMEANNKSAVSGKLTDLRTNKLVSVDSAFFAPSSKDLVTDPFIKRYIDKEVCTTDVNVPPRPPTEAELRRMAEYAPITEEFTASLPTLPAAGDETPYPVMYDYRWHTTHGIVASDSIYDWYVIQISNKGVHAFLLDMDPVSQTEEGRQRYLDVSPELTDFFDEFNGFPTSLGVPPSINLQEYIDAGEVLELVPKAQIKAFFDGQPYSTELGWSFDDRGTNAHNTMYKWESGKFWATGYHYSLDFTMQKPKAFTDSTSGITLAGRVANLGKHMVNKARRMTEEEAKAILRTWDNNAEAGLQAFKDAKVTSNLSGTALFQKRSEGALFHYGPLIVGGSLPIYLEEPHQLVHPAGGDVRLWSGQPQIKFPEPLIGGLVSFDFAGSKPWPSSRVPPECDTTMFVMHDGDDLKMINYFYTTKPSPHEAPEPPPEGCDAFGTYSSSSGSGASYHWCNFYTTDLDPRESLNINKSSTTSTTSKVGEFTTVEAIAFFAKCIVASSMNTMMTVSDTTAENGRARGSSIAIPLNDRCCYYHLQYDEVGTGVTKTHSEGFSSAFGGKTDIYNIFNFIFHWSIDCGGGPMLCIAIKTRQEVSDACIEASPAGLQYSVCGSTVTNNSAPPAGILGSGVIPPGGNKTPSSGTTNNSLGRKVSEKLHIHQAGHGMWIDYNETLQGGDYFSLQKSSWWFKPSPDADGNVADLRATRSCLGGNISNYDRDFYGQVAHKGSPSDFTATTSSTYVGVIE